MIEITTWIAFGGVAVALGSLLLAYFAHRRDTNRDHSEEFKDAMDSELKPLQDTLERLKRNDELHFEAIGELERGHARLAQQVTDSERHTATSLTEIKGTCDRIMGYLMNNDRNNEHQ